jgi:hypothetical protein
MVVHAIIRRRWSALRYIFFIMEIHIGKIEDFLVTDFEKELFQATIANLKYLENPLRFNNFSYSARELIRHILSRLSPDSEILSCHWYKNETERDNGISRRQRIKYAIQGGLHDDYVMGKLGLDQSDLQKSIKKSINNLNKHTHIEQKTFNTSEDRIGEYVDLTLSSMVEFFDTIRECKNQITDSLEEEIDSEIVDYTLSETILSLDELASHHYIDEIRTEVVKITKIDHEFIHIAARGTVCVELQWGSNSDLRKDFGATLDQSFPFNCELKSLTSKPQKFDSSLTHFTADTDRWYGEI